MQNLCSISAESNFDEYSFVVRRVVSSTDFRGIKGKNRINRFVFLISTKIRRIYRVSPIRSAEVPGQVRSAEVPGRRRDAAHPPTLLLHQATLHGDAYALHVPQVRGVDGQQRTAADPLRVRIVSSFLFCVGGSEGQERGGVLRLRNDKCISEPELVDRPFPIVITLTAVKKRTA